MADDYLLDDENWKLEAQSVIGDIKNHVKSVCLSEKLQSTNQLIFLNLETLENKTFCIELSGRGFRIVSSNFDQVDIDSTDYYETPYSLLNHISPEFGISFGNELVEKLKHV